MRRQHRRHRPYHLSNRICQAGSTTGKGGVKSKYLTRSKRLSAPPARRCGVAGGQITSNGPLQSDVRPARVRLNGSYKRQSLRTV